MYPHVGEVVLKRSKLALLFIFTISDTATSNVPLRIETHVEPGVLMSLLFSQHF